MTNLEKTDNIVTDRTAVPKNTITAHEMQENEEEMTSKEIQVKNLSLKGDHLPSHLVQLACRFDSSIEVITEGRRLNAKSLMGILSFPFTENMVITVVANGADEEVAVEAIDTYLH